MELKLKTHWDVKTDIDWWNTSRKKLNKIIDAYNNWQINGFDIDKSKKLLSKITYGKETIGSQDGGSGYWDELNEMENFVK